MSEEASPAVVAPTTMSGATMIGMSPWLAAAVVAAYGTKALWVKLRRVASASRKNCQDEPQQLQQDTEAESDDECGGSLNVEQDEMLKHFESDAGPINRSIKL